MLFIFVSLSCVSCYEVEDLSPDAGDGGDPYSGIADTRLSSYSSHFCKVNEENLVFCAGNNQFGQVGNGTTGGEKEVVRETLVEGVTATDVSVGFRHTCALLVSGRVACWGWSAFGQAGEADEEAVLTPTLIEGLENVVQVTGGSYSSCALDTLGDIYCWGMANHESQGSEDPGGPGYSDWTIGQTGPAPQLMPRIPDVDYLRGGGQTNCAITTDQRAMCWGAPVTTDDPAASSGDFRLRELLTDVTDLCIGNFYMCYIKGDELFCGANRDELHQPLQSVFDIGVVEVSAKSTKGPLSVRTAAGDVYSLDSPLENQFRGLSRVEDISDAVTVAAGHQFFCAILSSGETVCRSPLAFF